MVLRLMLTLAISTVLGAGAVAGGLLLFEFGPPQATPAMAGGLSRDGSAAGTDRSAAADPPGESAPQPGAPGEPVPEVGNGPAASPFRAAPPGSPEVPSPLPSGPLRRLATQERAVVLTFDDGPGRYTDQIAAVLHDAGVPAVFFWIGANVTEPALGSILARGHQVGSHTMTHARLTQVPEERLLAELSESKRVLAAGGREVRYFRPPYGAYNERTLSAASELSLKVVLWDVDSRDWELNQRPEQIVQNVLERVRPGSIILLHERAQTLDALPRLIAALREAGYAFRPLPVPPAAE
jgi:peptidoglycan-N-acetylglucosamine deacetylase